MLAAQGVDVSPARVHISGRAHVITPGHMALDGASERALGGESIGTTRRGIGPAYMDKAARTGILTGAMRDPGLQQDEFIRGGVGIGAGKPSFGQTRVGGGPLPQSGQADGAVIGAV